MLRAQTTRKASKSNNRGSANSPWHQPREPKSRNSKACRENIVALVASLSRGKCCPKHMGPRLSPALPRLSSQRAHECLWEGWHGTVRAVDTVAGCDNSDPSTSCAPSPGHPHHRSPRPHSSSVGSGFSLQLFGFHIFLILLQV